MTAVYSFNPAANNPLRNINRGVRYAPAFADVDGDGDMDLVVGWTERAEGKIRYYENTGTDRAPRFTERTDTQNPFNGIVLGRGQNPVPALGDVDGDGDMDLVFGDRGGDINYYENTGTAADATAPTFVRRTDAANPFNGIDVNSSADNGYSAPALGDLDGDGDLDLAVGDEDGRIRYYENIGNAQAPEFSSSSESGANNPFDGIDVGNDAKPALVDMDRDGDLDLVVGGRGGNFHYYENTGTAQAPIFTARAGDANPLNGVNAGAYAAPAFADLDGDGALELAFGSDQNGLKYVESAVDWLVRQVHDEAGRLISTTWLDYRQAGTFGGVVESSNLTAPKDFFAPAFADLDNDDDQDLLVGNGNGKFDYYENTGSDTAPTFVKNNAVNPLSRDIDGHRINIGGHAAPAFADLNGDGDMDLLVGKGNGTFAYFENTSNAGTLAFTERTGAANPLNINVGGRAGRTAPAFADLDDDGDMDLLVGKGNGTFAYFENTGNAQEATFTARTGTANPLNGIDIGEHAAPAFADLDGDGDLDLLVGRRSGDFAYFENTGIVNAPAFLWRRDLRTLLDDLDVKSYARPAFADLDGDGLLDLVVGGGHGQFHHYRPTAISRDTYTYNGDGAVIQANYDIGADGTIERSAFDAAGDGTVDRVESYSYNADGSLSHTRFDDDADGLYDRHRTHRDDRPDIVVSYQRNEAGRLVSFGTDRNEDGADEVSTHVGRDAAGNRLQSVAVLAGRTASHSLAYYNEAGAGERLAHGRDGADAGRVLDSLSYSSIFDVVAEIRDTVANAAAGLMDARHLAGVPRIALGGADISRTDLTLSVEALSVLAADDAGYQLQIDGDREDVLRFDMADFTEGDAVDVDGETYRRFAGADAGATGSFIVDPDVVLLGVGEARPVLSAVGVDIMDEMNRVVRTDFDDTGDGSVDRSHFIPGGDGAVTRVESYTRDGAGELTHTRYDDDADGLYDRLRTHRDGTPDIVVSYQRDEADRLESFGTDRNEDGADEVTVRVGRDADGNRLLAASVLAGRTASHSIAYYNEAGERLAKGRDGADAGRVLDSFSYSTLFDVVAEIRDAVVNAEAGLMDARLLAGVPRIVLAGAAAARTDLTLSAAALSVLAAGDAGYQLQIDGDWEDILRFDMADFTEGAAVDVDGEAYRQFAGAVAGAVGSFIVDPDVTLVDI